MPGPALRGDCDARRTLSFCGGECIGRTTARKRPVRVCSCVSVRCRRARRRRCARRRRRERPHAVRRYERQDRRYRTRPRCGRDGDRAASEPHRRVHRRRDCCARANRRHCDSRGSDTRRRHRETLLPGYVGMHNHLFIGTETPRPMWRSMPYSFPRLYLAAGTTTIRTTGSMDIFSDLSVRRHVDAGEEPGPHIDVTSPYLTGPGNTDPQMVELRNPVDARTIVDFWADHGATVVQSVYGHYARSARSGDRRSPSSRPQGDGTSVLRRLSRSCAARNRRVRARALLHGYRVHDRQAVECVPSLTDQFVANEALSVDGPQVRALIADLVGRHIAVSSTLPVYESFLANRPPGPVIQPTLDLLDPEVRADVISVRAKLADGSDLRAKDPRRAEGPPESVRARLRERGRVRARVFSRGRHAHRGPRS